MTMTTPSKQAIDDLVREIRSLIEQMLEYRKDDEPRSETLARASLIKSGTTYIEALTLIQQGESMPLDDLNDLVALSTSFINDVSRCLPQEPAKEKTMIERTRLDNRDPKDTVEGDIRADSLLRFIQAECLAEDDLTLTVALAKPLTMQFAGETSIDVLEELGEIEGLNHDLLADAVVMASARAEESNQGHG